MSAADQDPKELPLVAHLLELRDRLLRSIAVVLVLFVLLFNWANDIYEFVSDPLTQQLENATISDPQTQPLESEIISDPLTQPLESEIISDPLTQQKEAPQKDNEIIAINPLDPFMIPMKLTFMVALFLAFPYILHQAWAFISPGLYKNEIRVTLPILVSSVVLFYAGLAFCYYVVLGFLFNFLLQSAPDNVAVMTDMGAYYSFAMSLFLIFGIVFEIPVATVLLVISGVVTPQSLVDKRPYIIVGCFVVAVPLTPPDPISLFMMAMPMWFLFEIGLLGSRLFYKPEDEPETETPAT